MRCAATLILASFAISQGQTSSTVSVSNGVEIQVTADLGDPTGRQTVTVEMARASGKSFYRILWDQNKLAIFAYELAVDLSASGDAVLAVAKPVLTEFADRYPNANGGKPVPTLSGDQELGPLTSGQKAELPLFEIPGMGLKVSETIRVKMGQSGGAGAIRLAGLRVSIDGKLVSGPPPPGAVSGRYAMFYLPGQGGYFFATLPPTNSSRATFINAGFVDRNHMSFTVDNQNFDCVATAPIVADSAGLWVYHDPSYQPEGKWTQDPHSMSQTEQFFMGASDSLSWWLP